MYMYVWLNSVCYSAHSHNPYSIAEVCSDISWVILASAVTVSPLPLSLYIVHKGLCSPCCSLTTLQQRAGKMQSKVPQKEMETITETKRQSDLHNKSPDALHPSPFLQLRNGARFGPNTDVRVHGRCTILHHPLLFLPPSFHSCCGTDTRLPLARRPHQLSIPIECIAENAFLISAACGCCTEK